MTAEALEGPYIRFLDSETLNRSGIKSSRTNLSSERRRRERVGKQRV